MARKQIVVSGGTMSSPLILQRSGIGNAEKLKKVGIEPIVDLPGVGLNFQDHYLTFSGKSPSSREQMHVLTRDSFPSKAR